MTDTASSDGLGWQSRLSVVVPAYNEEAGIALSLQNLKERLPDVEVIVVDDGSSDGTAREAASVSGIVLVRHPFNQGYGAALRTGMLRATRDYVAWFDADNEHRVEDLIAMVERLERERLVAVIGRRLTPSSSVLRSSGKFVIRMLARSLRVNMGQDLNCGLRVFRRAIISRYYSLLPSRFSASLTSSMIMFERGYPIAFHDIRINQRLGTSKVRVADGFEAMTLVLRMVMLFAPLRIFFGGGALLASVGAAYSAALALVVGEGVPTLGALVVLLGLLLCLLGLIADQISQLRLGQLPNSEQPDADAAAAVVTTSR